MHRILSVVFCLCATPAIAQIKTGDISFSYQGSETGTRINFADVPVIRGTSIQLHAPQWTKGYFSSSSDPAEYRVSGDRLTIGHRARKVKFDVTETISPAGANAIEIVLKGRLDSDVEAELEWCLGYVNVWTLYGGAVSAEKSDAVVAITPEAPKAREPIAIVGPTDGVRLTGPLGRITVRMIEGPAELTVLDGRRAPTRWWAGESPTLWVGILDTKIKPREPFQFRVKIEFAPRKRAKEIGQVIEANAPAIRVEKAIEPQSRDLRIIPKPKSVKWREGGFFLSPGTRIIIDDEIERRGAEVVRREAQQRFGWDWPIVLAQKSEENDIRFTTKFLQHELMAPEGYRITSSGVELTIAANAPAGFFFAAQTLCQLFQSKIVDSKGQFVSVFFPGCEIDDSPSLQFRGVHLFTGRDAMSFHKKLVERVLSRFKFNHLILEADYTQWETDPKIWGKISAPKAQVAEYVKLARDNFIEPIPLVQSLGHMEWMFANGRNRELAEDPEAKWAYAVTEPKTYDWIHGVYREAMEIFSPKYFHIGHDEVAIRGRYPYREEAKRLGETKLFIEDVKKHEALFKSPDKSPRLSRGLEPVKMMLWGDMLLSREESNDSAANAPSLAEAKTRRDALPRDAIICDWHYDPAKPAAYKSLKVFKDEGFKTIACTWYRPENIYNFAEAARLYGAWGLLQTTWAGYSIDENALDRAAKQFTAYVLAAEYAWSGDSPPPDQLGYDPAEVFAEAMNPRREPIGPRAGARLDLSKAVNMPLAGEVFDLSPLGKSDRLAGVSFQSSGAVILAGALLPAKVKASKRVALATDVRAGELAFFHATLFPANSGEAVAAYEIGYADGSDETIPIRYGREIRAWDDPAATFRATRAFSGAAKNGVPVCVRMLWWSNPHPEKTIARITFSTDQAYASPMVVGITAIAGG